MTTDHRLNLPHRPTRSAGLTLRDIGGEALIYGAGQQVVHILNPTARLIWDLCDGDHSVAEIAHELRRHYAVADDDNLAADIDDALQVFVAKGLIVVQHTT